MFEITLGDPAPSLSAFSAFPDEREFILSPYRRFRLLGVSWSDALGRWIIRVEDVVQASPDSWLTSSADAE
jgi:hypothetical protein